VQVLVLDGNVRTLLKYISGSRYRAQLFPNLKSIKSKRSDLADLLHVLVHEGVRSLATSLRNDYVPLTILADAAQRMPFLENLKLEVSNTNLGSLTQFQFQHLKTLDIRGHSFCWSDLQFLSRMKYLQVAKFLYRNWSRLGPRPVGFLAPNPFEYLAGLHLTICIPDAMELLEILPCVLLTLEIHHHEKACPCIIRSFFKFLSKFQSQLRSIAVTLYGLCEKCGADKDTVPRIDTFSPLFTMPLLEDFAFVHKFQYFPRLTDMEDLAKAFSSLKSLAIFSGCPQKHLPPAKAILPLAKRCLNLQSLGFTMRLLERDISQAIEFCSTPFKQLAKFDVGGSFFSTRDRLLVAQFLLRICPKGCIIEKGQGKIGDDNFIIDKHDGYGVGYGEWDSVCGWMEALQKAREEGIKFARQDSRLNAQDMKVV
jgi:hypothetical protein